MCDYKGQICACASISVFAHVYACVCAWMWCAWACFYIMVATKCVVFTLWRRFCFPKQCLQGLLKKPKELKSFFLLFTDIKARIRFGFRHSIN